VRGRLVPQDPNDEPASELLRRIAKEKAQRIKAEQFQEPRSFIKIARRIAVYSCPALGMGASDRHCKTELWVCVPLGSI
jgi:hypothetical protein